MPSITINFPDELPLGRKNSFLKGIIDGLIEVATSETPLDHTPEGHELYRKKGIPVAVQIIDGVEKIVKR